MKLTNTATQSDRTQHISSVAINSNHGRFILL